MRLFLFLGQTVKSRIAVTGAAFVLTSTIVGPAFSAEDSYGTPEGAAPCLQGTWYYSDWKQKASDACKAEIAQRLDKCLQDPEQRKIIDDPQYVAHKDPKGYCKEVAEEKIEHQMDEYLKQQEARKDLEARQAKLDGTEVPKAKMHDPLLEKAVASAYNKAYPGNKILKVVLGNWSDDYEKDVFGRVTGRDLYATIVNRHPDGKCELHGELWLQHGKGKSFSGPLSARGAGSAETNQISCSKVGASSARK
jgi:hypothetical protein